MRLADPTAEASFLALCLDMPEGLDAGLTVEHLSVPSHRLALSCMLAMRSAGEPIDDLTLAHQLARRTDDGQARRIVTSLRDAPVRGLSSLVPVIRRCYEARSLHEAGLAGAAQAEAGDLDDARATLSKAAFGGAGTFEVFTLRDAMESAAEEWLAASKERSDPKRVRYVRLGLCQSVDGVLSAGPGDTVIIAAETNVGKSSLSMTCLLDLQRRGIPAALVSVEDPKADWGAKAVGHYAQTDVSSLWVGEGSEQTWARVMDGIGRVAGDEQHVRMAVAKSGELAEVQQAMAAMVRAHGAKILFVDYIQAIKSPLRNATPKQAIDHVYQSLQATARMLEVPLVLGSQLARAQDQKDGKEPSLSRLKESGNLENGAQAVLMFWAEPDADGKWSRIRGKVAKLKRSHTRPRWLMERRHGGVLVEVDDDTNPYSSPGQRGPW